MSEKEKPSQASILQGIAIIIFSIPLTLTGLLIDNGILPMIIAGLFVGFVGMIYSII